MKKDNFDWCWNDNQINSTDLKANKDLSIELFDKMMEPATPAACPWFKSLPVFFREKHDIKRIWEIHKELILNPPKGPEDVPPFIPGNKSARSCPAINSFLKQSYILKFPCDIAVTINSDGQWQASETRQDLMVLEGHPAEQYQSGIFENKVNIKFCYPIRITTDNIPWGFYQPIYHEEQPFTVTPGIVDGKWTKSQELNINTVFNKPEKGQVDHYHFKTGDAFAYIRFEKRLTPNFIPYDTKYWKNYWTDWFHKRFSDDD